VISIALTRPVSGSWTDWVAWGLECHENTALPRNAERLARTLIDRIGAAITRPRQQFLDEDYLVFAITGAKTPIGGVAARLRTATRFAQLLRGERSSVERRRA
jgi:hypothetical protein